MVSLKIAALSLGAAGLFASPFVAEAHLLPRPDAATPSLSPHERLELAVDALKSKALKRIDRALERVDKKLDRVAEQEQLPEAKRERITERLETAERRLEDAKAKVNEAETIDDLKELHREAMRHPAVRHMIRHHTEQK